MEGSPTLSQMLVNPSESFGSFMYPNISGKSSLQTPHNGDLPAAKGVNVREMSPTCTTPVSLPAKRLPYSSGAKSLGIRRRMRSYENTASPVLGIKRRKIANLSTPIKSQKPNSVNCADPSDTSKNLVTPKRGITAHREISTEGRQCGRPGFLRKRGVVKKSFNSPLQNSRIITDEKDQDTDMLSETQDAGNKETVNKLIEIPELTEISCSGADTGLTTGGADALNVKKAIPHTQKTEQLNENTANASNVVSRDVPAISQNSNSESISNIENKAPNAITPSQTWPKTWVQGNNSSIGLTGFRTANDRSIHVSKKALKFAENLIKNVKESEDDSGNKILVKSNVVQSLVRSPVASHEGNPNSGVPLEGNTQDTDDLPDELLSSIDLDQISPCVDRTPSPVLLSKRSWRRRRTDESMHVTLPPKSPVAETNKPPLNCSLMSDGFDIELLAVDLTEKFDEECYADVVAQKTSKEPSPGPIEAVCEKTPPLVVEQVNFPLVEVHNMASQTPQHSKEGISLSRPASGTFPLMPDKKNCLDEKFHSKILSTRMLDPEKVKEEHSEDDGFGSDDEMLLKFGDEMDRVQNATECNIPVQSIKHGNECAANTNSSLPSRGVKDSDPKRNKQSNSLATKPCTVASMKQTATGFVPANLSEVTAGFTTASNKPVHISDSALAKAQKFLSDDTHAGSALSTGTDRAVKEDTTLGIDTGELFAGFKTASNKPVLISEAALAKAQEILNMDNTKDASPLSCAKAPSPDDDYSENDTEHVEKLSNLFKRGSCIGKRKNRDFKPPGRLKFQSPLKTVKQPATLKCAGANTSVAEVASSRKLLGVKNISDSQIAVSDESLLKAAEMLEDLLG